MVNQTSTNGSDGGDHPGSIQDGGGGSGWYMQITHQHLETNKVSMFWKSVNKTLPKVRGFDIQSISCRNGLTVNKLQAQWEDKWDKWTLIRTQMDNEDDRNPGQWMITANQNPSSVLSLVELFVDMFTCWLHVNPCWTVLLIHPPVQHRPRSLVRDKLLLVLSHLMYELTCSFLALHYSMHCSVLF